MNACLRLAMATLCVIAVGTSVVERAQAQDPATAIAGSMVVGNILDDLEIKAQTLISQLEGSVSRQSFEIRQHVGFIVQNVKLALADSLDKTFDGLDAQRRATLQDARTALATLDTSRADALADVRKTAKAIERIVTALPGANRLPYVSSIEPTFVLAPDPAARSTVRVVVDGVRLAAGTPQLAVRGLNCAAHEETEDKLSFLCPSAAFVPTGAEVMPVSGFLTVENPRGFWSWIKSWFSDDVLRSTYAVGLFAVPRELGTYRLRATSQQVQRESRVRTVRNGHRNDHCSGDRELVWTASADNGDPAGRWYIDVASVSARETSRSSNSTYGGAWSITADGFQYGGAARNNGTCGPRIPFTNDRAYYDGRGWLEVEVTFTEYRDRPTNVESEIASGALAWGRDEAFALPDGLQGYVLELKRIDNNLDVIAGSSAGEAYTSKWLNVQYKPDTRTLLVEPQSIDAAM